MKTFRYILFIVMCSQLSGCFMYQNTSYWEKTGEAAIQKPQNNLTATKVDFELNKKLRLIVLPFLLITYNKKKNIYTPSLRVMSPFESGAAAIVYFHFSILDSRDSIIFTDTVTDKFKLVALQSDGRNVHMAIFTNLGQNYKIDALQNLSDDIKVNYELHILNKDSTVNIMEFQNLVFSKKRRKGFSHFF